MKCHVSKINQILFSDDKEFNDPIRQFFNDVVERASWDIMPFALLYEMYLKWFKANNPSGTPQNRNTFINDIVVVANQSEEWVCENQRKQIRIGNKMSCCEPLLDEFECKTWYNKQVTINIKFNNNKKERYICHELLY